MSSRSNATAVASRVSLPTAPSARRSAAGVTGSAVAKANPSVSSASRTTASLARAAAPPRQSPAVNGRLGTGDGTLRRLNSRGAARSIAVVARASLSNSRAGAAPRSPGTVNGNNSLGLSAFSPGPTNTIEVATFDDESFARELAREEDEALALSIARQQECANDASLAGVLGVDLDDSLAAAIAASTAGPGSGGLFGMEQAELDFPALLALGYASMNNAVNASVIAEPPRPRGPSLSQIQRLPTRRVTSDSLASVGEAGGDQECPVCFAGYAVGEELRTLPCMHAFHVECIDRWLTSGREGASTCPICHTEVNLRE